VREFFTLLVILTGCITALALIGSYIPLPSTAMAMVAIFFGTMIVCCGLRLYGMFAILIGNIMMGRWDRI